VGLFGGVFLLFCLKGGKLGLKGTFLLK